MAANMGVPGNRVGLGTPGGPDSEASIGQWFSTTHWSTVLAAGDEANPVAQSARESLCATYWYPLYAYIRRSGRDAEEARDLTQEFFANFLSRNRVSYADPARGRFRTFLLTAMKYFLANEWKKENRLKRGGGQHLLPLDADAGEQRFAAEPADSVTPEVIYERRWAVTLLELVLRRLGEECAAAGRGEQFEQLKANLWGDNQDMTQAEIAACLGMTESAYKVSAHRMRARYRELLREEIAHTVASPADIDDELRHLAAVVSA